LPAEDENDDVLKAVKKNPKTPFEVHLRIHYHDHDYCIDILDDDEEDVVPG
jgi:hypothetical protein